MVLPVFPEEAAAKAGGLEGLRQGVLAGRIVQTKAGGMARFFFPRWEFSKENLYKQELQAATEKEGSMGTMDVVQQDMWGFQWDPMGPGQDPGAMLGMAGSGANSSSMPLPMSGANSSSMPLPMSGANSSSMPLPMSSSMPLPMSGANTSSMSSPMSGANPLSMPLPMSGACTPTMPVPSMSTGLAAWSLGGT